MITTQINLPVATSAQALPAPRANGAPSLPYNAVTPPEAAVDGPNSDWSPDDPVNEDASPSSGTPTGRSLVPITIHTDESGRRSTAQTLYLAQHIAQERLAEGLYVDPQPAGIRAYRGVLSVVGGRADLSPSAAGFDIQA